MTCAAATDDAVFSAGVTSSSFYGQANAGSGDGFLIKHDLAGNRLWTRFLGTSSSDRISGIVTDPSGNAYVTGYTSGNLDGQTNAGREDYFVAKYDSNGNRLFSKLFGDAGRNETSGIAVGLDGAIFVTGLTDSSLGGKPYAGANDAFVTKLDNAGNELWTSLYGASTSENSVGIGVDAAGRAWIGGDVAELNGSPFFVDLFVAVFDGNGTLVDDVIFGSNSTEQIRGLAIAPDGAYVAGYTNGNLGGPVNGGPDAFVAKIIHEPPASLLLLSALLIFQLGDGTFLRRAIAADRSENLAAAWFISFWKIPRISNSSGSLSRP